MTRPRLWTPDHEQNLKRLFIAEQKIPSVVLDPYYRDDRRDFAQSAIRVEIGKWHSEEEYNAWKAGMGVQPFEARFAGKYELEEVGGLLVNRGGNYICKKLREVSAASVVGAGNHGSTLVHYDSANAFVIVSTSITNPAVTDTDLAATATRAAMTNDGGTPASFPKVGTYDASSTANSETYMDLNYLSGVANAFVAVRSILFSGVYTSGMHNLDWRTFGVANAAAGGTLLDHFEPGTTQGTKASGQVWQLWITIQIS
jgi:hypothetical protein